MNEIGPVQVLVIDFGPEAQLEGRILKELERLEESGTVRVLDVLFVRKDPGGDLLALGLQGETLGSIVGALLGFEFDTDEEGHEVAVRLGTGAFGLSKEKLVSIAASLDPGRSAGIVLIEHVWARHFKRAVRDAGGTPIAEGFLAPAAVAEVQGELAAMSAAIEEEQAAASVA